MKNARSITTREKEILSLIAFEHTVKEIASELYIGIDTVKSHSKNIKLKLGVKSKAGMIRVACTQQLIDV